MNGDLRNISKEALEAIADAIPAGVVVIEKANGKIAYVNEKAISLYGVDPRGLELPEHSTKLMKILTLNGEIYPPEQLPASKALLTGKEAKDELIIERSDGSRVIVDASAKPIKDKNGQVIAAVGIFDDVTERKKAEEAIQSSEKQKTDILESITDGFVAFDKEWRYTYVNSNAARILQTPKEKLIGKVALEVFPNSSKFLAEFKRAVSSGHPVHFEEYYPEPLNIWYECHCYPSQNGLTVFFSDITQRKKAEEALKESANRLSRIAQAGQIGFFEYNATKDIAYWSPEHYYLFGYERDSIISMLKWLQGVYPEDRQRIQDNFAQLMKEGQIKGQVQSHKDEYRYIRPDKSVIWVESELSLSTVNNEVILQGSVRNITERKKAEEALKESESKFKTLAENAPDAIMRFDKNLRILYLNPQDLAATGKPLDELVGKTNEEIGMPAELCKLWNDTFYRAKTSRKAQEVEFDFNTPIGLKTFNLRIVPEFSETGSLRSYIGISRDISERKKAEEKLEEYQQNLEKLVEERTKQLKDSERLAAIGATAGMVGHDIRNPLQAITSDLFLAKSELSELPENENKINALESLNEIQNNIDYINKIVADLQDFARPLNPRAQESNIKSVFNEILAKNGIPKNIKVTVEVEDKAENIMADPDYLKRIAANLTLNAVQAMPDGGRLTIHAYCDKQTNDVLITVKDTGVGIPEDIKPKLFTPMMTTKSKGQGFGLAVVKRMTEGLGGTVTFESTQGKGTTFTVRLPPPKELNGKWTYK